MSDQYGLGQPRQQQGWPAQPPQYSQAPQYYQHAAPRQRRKRRVFMWVFLAIQALFVVWLVVGLATTQTGPTHAQLVSACYHHAWWPLFQSQADCVTHYGGALTAAGNVGKGLGAAVIVLVWVVVDVLLGITYGIYRLASRR